MAYDSTQPTNTTKLRNVGVVIRPNWIAIEDGDPTFKPKAINLNNRTPLGVPNDPAAIANSYVLYSKQDPAGNVQLYGIDPASRVTQMSLAVSPSSAANGYTWLAGGMLMQWGQAHANGSANTTIGFPVGFSGVPYSIQTNFWRSSGSTTMKPLDVLNGGTPVTANNFTVWNANGGHDFFWLAIGPKV